MTHAAIWAVLFLIAEVISLPVTNPTTQDDTKVMKCIAEVISDTVSRPDPIPISEECLETLQGDERIRSILRHQNLLKELQEIADQGANERTELQKKGHGFEDELSEVLERQNNKNTERDLSEETPDEDPVASLAELEVEKSQENRKTDVSKEEGRSSLEERGPRVRDVETEDDKENRMAFDTNRVGENDVLPWNDGMDNHLLNDDQDDDVPEQRGADDFEEEEDHASQHSHGESKEEGEDNVRKRAEEEEEEEDEEEEKDGGGREDDAEEEEKEKNSKEEHPTSSEDVEGQSEDDNQDTEGFERDENVSEEKEIYHRTKEGRHHSLDETRLDDDDTSHARDAESEEMEDNSSRVLEDAKRWNKMDDLAKQLTTTKHAEETESSEDPDRSMKLAMRSHKYDFHNSEDNTGVPPKHHSKEESNEGDSPPIVMPEGKKGEEGSANRRTEEQDLESLATIEAELEKVAHKLHALRRG